MKILILGHGAVGSVLKKLLQKEHVHVISADVKNIRSSNHVKIDLKNKRQLVRLLKREMPTVAVNAASPLLNPTILDACAMTGVNYMDLAASWEPDADKKAVCPYKIEQFDFDKRFREKNLFGLIEAGVSPGMTNLFVRECADEFDELESVKIRLVDYSGTDELHFAWSKEALLDEINSKPLVYRNGKFEVMEPFSGDEEYPFPKPYGRQHVSLICQDEIGTIPFFIKLKNIDIKDYDNQVETHKFLYKLGIVSKKKVKFGKIEISPFEFINKILPDVQCDSTDAKLRNAQFAFAVEAAGRIGNKKKKMRYYVSFPRQKDINKLGLRASFISYPTALCAKIFVIAMHMTKTNGIIPPEALDKEVRSYISSELRKYVSVRKEWM